MAYTAGYKMSTAFFKVSMRKPYSTLPVVKETFTMDTQTVRNAQFGDGGRFIDIIYDPIVGESEPDSDQITFSNSDF